MTIIAWIPFLQPAGVPENYWWVLMFPLVFGISIAYRATHDHSIDHFWYRVSLFTAKSILAMGSLALVLYLFVYWIIPIFHVG